MVSPAVHFRTHDGQTATLRPASAGDGAGIVAALNQVSAEGVYLAAEAARWTPSEMEEIIAGMTTHPFILVAIVGEQLVGHAFLQRGTLKKNRHAAGLGMLVIPGFRGIGIGTKMLEYIDNWGRREGLRRLFLSLFSTNHRAYHLYRKAGFDEEGRRPEQYRFGDTPVDEILMGKFLNGDPAAENGRL